MCLSSYGGARSPGSPVFDFVVHVRKAHIPTLREAGLWSARLHGDRLLFGVGVQATEMAG